jgi:hypothetical protein
MTSVDGIIDLLHHKGRIRLFVWAQPLARVIRPSYPVRRLLLLQTACSGAEQLRKHGGQRARVRVQRAIRRGCFTRSGRRLSS